MKYQQYYRRNDYKMYEQAIHNHPEGINPPIHLVDEDFCDLKSHSKFFTNKFNPYYAYSRVYLP